MKIQTKINQIERKYDAALSRGNFNKTQTYEAQSRYLTAQLRKGQTDLTDEMQAHLDWQDRTNGAA